MAHSSSPGTMFGVDTLARRTRHPHQYPHGDSGFLTGRARSQSARDGACLMARRVKSFAPASRTDAGVLVLGSMPGDASLRAGEYYAHARNHFWPFMGELVGALPQMPYTERLSRLHDAVLEAIGVL